MIKHADVAIIGAGMAGASLAFELSGKRSAVLIEREEQPGYHTTGRSAAVYLKTYGNAVIRALSVASESFLQHPPEGFTEVPLVTPRGAIQIAREDQLGEIEPSLAGMQRFVPECRRLDRDEVLAMVPQLRADYVAGGIIDPDAQDLDVAAILDGYLKGFRAGGGELLTDAEVLKLEPAGDGWRIETRAGTIEAKIVVNAAGAWADELAALAGLGRIGLEPRRRTAFLIDPPEDSQSEHWPVVTDIQEQFYFKPDAGKLLCSPADATPSEPCDAQPEELDVAIAVDRIEKALEVSVRRINHKWAGLRSFVADGSPVVGMDPRAPGFFWLAGQGGYGIQSAPGVSQVAAALITGKAPALELDWQAMTHEMRPGRLIG